MNPMHLYPKSFPYDNPTAYDRIAFIAEHYEDLKQMYFTIMEHLKIPDGEGGGSSLWEEVSPITFDAKHMPLFKVEGNTYAIPIPFEELDAFTQIVLCYVGTPYTLSDGHIALFRPNNLYIDFVDEFSGSIEKHNHAIVSGLENHLNLVDLTDKPEEFTFNMIRPIEDRQVLGG